MIIPLFCPRCLMEAKNKLGTKPYIRVPISQLSDNGIYQVNCSNGHTENVILDNVKFELLFEMGLNALIDGYPREAVSSFASSLERFHEFYWRVAMTHFGLSQSQISLAWKPMAKMSERQIGAYVTATLALEKNTPNLLNDNTQVSFRNNVIHNGYVPRIEEAIRFGDSVMERINERLIFLRTLKCNSLDEVYKTLSPREFNDKNDDQDKETLIGCINILTAIDVRHPPTKNDRRVGDVRSQMNRIYDERQPMKMTLLTEEEMKRIQTTKK
ncbi:hypothetical protein [Thalassospira sp. MCCC 1A01428]|uniref:hypothetical protein n=1 Tax=Thalassospira sp. MCCC 1A01428 TaxID=1470575 RepID=UPI000A1E83E7|nr:hypothetical protein [Thalassospira sp. MCCC 1A01428]